jgi:cathepsin L
MANYVLGAIPSLQEDGDYKVTQQVATPVDPILIPFKGTVKDHRKFQSCVADSLSYVLEIKKFKQSGEVVTFSSGFIYGCRTFGQNNTDPGMSPRDALRNLKDVGAVSQQLFPDMAEMPDIYQMVNGIFDRLEPYAAKNRIADYTGLRTNENDLKIAIKNMGPITAMFPITESFEVDADNPVVDHSSIGSDSNEQHHMMTILGWDSDDNWIVLNSWGQGWGRNGYCLWPISMTDKIKEAWSVSDTQLS